MPRLSAQPFCIPQTPNERIRRTELGESTTTLTVASTEKQAPNTKTHTPSQASTDMSWRKLRAPAAPARRLGYAYPVALRGQARQCHRQQASQELASLAKGQPRARRSGCTGAGNTDVPIRHTFFSFPLPQICTSKRLTVENRSSHSASRFLRPAPLGLDIMYTADSFPSYPCACTLAKFCSGKEKHLPRQSLTTSCRAVYCAVSPYTTGHVIVVLLRLHTCSGVSPL